MFPQTSKSIKITAGVPITSTEITTQPVNSTATLHVQTAYDTIIISQPAVDNSNVDQAKATIAAEQAPGKVNVNKFE